ncbi:MAG: T9SS type A sorting domain-containing protein [Bacteroidota bacterium]|nr:T9SS type A sorting domain-containing protein [Bacteroidota bacterium]
MRISILLVISYFIISHSSLSQKLVLQHSMENVSQYDDYTFAEDNFYLETGTLVHGYNLLNLRSFLSENFDHKIAQFSYVKNKALYIGYNMDNSIYTVDSLKKEILIGNIGRYNLNIHPGKNFSLISSINKVYATDGTPEGNHEIYSNPGDQWLSSAIYVASKNIFYFALKGTKESNIYQTDGTPGGTKLIDSYQEFSTWGLHFSKTPDNTVYFTRYLTDSNSSFRTTQINKVSNIQGSVELISTNPYIHNYGQQIAVVNNQVLSFTFNEHQKDRFLVKVEGDTVENLIPATDSAQFVGYLKNEALFTMLNKEKQLCLYRTDGSVEGTRIITKNLGSNEIIFYNNVLYFVGIDAEHGPEIWKYDGFTVSLVDDVENGVAGLQEVSFHTYNNELYFSARSTTNTSQLNIYKLSDDASTININSFADYNQNKIQDADEPSMPYQHYIIKPNNLHFFPTQNPGKINLKNGTYEISLVPQAGWRLPEDLVSISINLPDEANKQINFGLIADSIFTYIETKITPGSSRCSSATTFNLYYKNTGTTIASGNLTFKPDSRFTFDDADPKAGGDISKGLTWELGPLYPQQGGKIKISLVTPNFESMGDTLASKVFSNFNSETASTFYDTLTLEQVVTCSYDPNDIQVTPMGKGEKHLTLKNQDLDYFIRFQNTGNDTAYHVVVMDTLKSHFDMNSVRIIGSSHNMVTTVTDNILKFQFDKIMLPDSTTDEPGSHGYILYSIKPTPRLPDYTVLYNKAEIYFDFNPPISTNTVFNTLVDKFPQEEERVTGIMEPLSKLYTIYPNPTPDHININWIGEAVGKIIYQLKNNLGTDVMVSESSNKLERIDISNLPKGMYFLRMQWGKNAEVHRVIIR